MSGRAPFAAAAFLGSFLLFTLELVAAKLLLPSFGGAAYVWTTSMMVFQALLLAGYLFAQKALERGRYGRAHLAVLLLGLLWLPLRVSLPSGGSEIPRLVWALLAGVGFPFFALSTTSTVLQGWRRRAAPGDDAGTYSLYAASNAGSLAALVGYPFVIEPYLSVGAQLKAWTALYVAFAAAHAFLVPKAGAREERAPVTAAGRLQLAWVLLSLGPSAALLAATNLLTLDFAAVPLLWIVPLALYLSTFVLNFKKKPWYPKRLSLTLVFAMLIWVALVLLTVLYSADLSDRWQAIRRLWVVNKFVFICSSLFILCLICHRALAKARPPAEESPRYYALMALGGFLGSALIALVMPLAARRLAMPELDWALAGALSLGALLFRDWAEGEKRLEEGGPNRWSLAAIALLGAAGLAFYVNQSPAFEKGTLYSLRNFYGYNRVVDKEGHRRFFHGNTLHGLQPLDLAKRREPLLYFHRGSPIGELFGAFRGQFHSVGVMGLGVGILAAYSEPGQRFDYYELDPDVVHVARAYFTYLADSPAQISVSTGDARLTLARAPADTRYDLIVLDAFTGGAIPVHMLTDEAFDLYESRLSSGGLVAVHITNRFLNLRPAMAALARARGLNVAAKQTDLKTLRDEHYYSSWVVLSRDQKKIDVLRRLGWEPLDRERPVRPWTDGYASLLSALKS